MKIVYKKTEELIPYINNPRKNDNAVDAVASSIKNFGFKVPIVIDAKNEIVAGHTRLKAAKKLGMEEIPCVVADDLSDAQIKAFRIADNKVSEFAEWDEDKLTMELEKLADEDVFTGFDFEELESLLDEEITEPEEKEIRPYTKGHYLITVDINHHDKVVELMQACREVEGVEVESTFN